MPAITLTPLESRILGCLLEKERITPDIYPLTLNSLTVACNQTTNRDPITGYDSRMVEGGLDSLRSKKLATVLFGAGSRVQKYRHNLLDHFSLGSAELALLCVLLLRGPQTLGELRARTDRMHRFANPEEVETVLRALGEDQSELVKILPPRPGQKERRYRQTLSELPEPDAAGVVEWENAAPGSPSSEPVSVSARLERLEKEIAAIKIRLDELSAAELAVAQSVTEAQRAS